LSYAPAFEKRGFLGRLKANSSCIPNPIITLDPVLFRIILRWKRRRVRIIAAAGKCGTATHSLAGARTVRGVSRAAAPKAAGIGPRAAITGACPIDHGDVSSFVSASSV